MRFQENPLLSRSLLLTVALVLVLLAVQSVRLGREVLVRLDGLSTAATDSLQWTLSQAEIEHLRLETEVLAAKKIEDLAQLRRSFDIVYSRVATIRESRTFALVRDAPENRDILPRVVQRIDRLVAYIDGPDEALLFGLPRVSEILQENRSDLRNLALAGLTEHAKASEEKRLNFFALLSRLAWVVLALFVALTLTALMMGRLYQRGKRLALRTREAVARMRAMVSSSLDAILVVDHEGRVQEFNGAAETIFGYTSAEAIGQDMAELIVPDHLREAHDAGMNSYRSTGTERVIGRGRIQLEAKRKSGEVFPVELSISTSQPGDSGPEKTVFVSYLRDISDRIAAEKALTHARDEALAGERAKAELLTVMSHEMRTPLTGVLGALDLLDGTELTAAQRSYAGLIRESGDRLMAHVNDVLQLSHLETGVENENQRVFDLERLAAEVVESHQSNARAARNTLELRCDLGAHAMVLGRPVALRQVLINLVENALDFTADGSVSVDLMRLGGGDTVEIYVADTGRGIAEEDLDRIFEDFIRLDASYARSSEGTGLGLAITRRSVEAMGGEISCESELGEGSLFTITLPLPAGMQPAGTGTDQTSGQRRSGFGSEITARAGIPETGAPSGSSACTPGQLIPGQSKPDKSSMSGFSAAQGAGAMPSASVNHAARAHQTAPHGQARTGSGHRILVVEDNEINRILVEKMLTKLGHHVTLAPGGAEGVAAARQDQFDLIFMDVSMPEIDGLEATRQIRAGGYADGVDIVALTAHAGAQDHDRILAGGLAEVVTKPISLERLEEVIGRRVSGDAPRRSHIGGVALCDIPGLDDEDPVIAVKSSSVVVQTSDISQFFGALGQEKGRMFLQQYQGDMAALLGDLGAETSLSAAQRDEAHRLAGSAAVLGFSDLRQALLDVEHAPQDQAADLSGLQAIWQLAEQEISRHLAA
ncbi:PAS domain-containing hybrid sensor histidine kinase/response regulator [Phaeobacter sp.]|uniref:hybrid sensor histidine kinase/response regulator n=1 Tax=Phaeobacter sp. TaxID=1902409 RepID=UPI0025DA4112|nr:PAS domain-containing hybrid sensor histidine kinase/response regulator [Phaeobacter sp.]